MSDVYILNSVGESTPCGAPAFIVVLILCYCIG